ncbi:hypothetical protein NBRC110019_16330 [Neptunitalea chrysea]|uniref:DUF7738 domain-containing protein n=1 Tax=Neptunitalea chrysea TaxID=1647581 RepID=A0A9W6B4P2_9FLAO|nr:hypothetical protein [Neptunitalea chrysea]GLB52593.1 hypothetical protein NBRC110019_16330 [Neptunitalea chrysea]
MSRLKHLYSLLILCFFLVNGTAFAQKKAYVITYNEQGITIDGVHISIKNSVKQLEDLIGTTARTQKFAGTAYAHIFDEAGMVVYSNDNHVEGLTLNFMANYEQGGPTKAFKGDFSINGTKVSKKTHQKTIYNLTDVDMHCPGSTYCDLQILQTPASCIISFNKKGKVAVANFTFVHPYIKPGNSKKPVN